MTRKKVKIMKNMEINFRLKIKIRMNMPHTKNQQLINPLITPNIYIL